MNREELIQVMQMTAAGKPKPVTVPGWGEVYVRDLTVAEVEAQADDTANAKDKNRIARGAARLICGADGKRMFDPDSASDVALLAAQPWKLLRQVIAASDIDIKADDAGN